MSGGAVDPGQGLGPQEGAPAPVRPLGLTMLGAADEGGACADGACATT
jgi:hypothetical protein